MFLYVLISRELQADVADVLILSGLLTATRCVGAPGDGVIGGVGELGRAARGTERSFDSLS